MNELAAFLPSEIDCASEEAQGAYLGALLTGRGPMEAAREAGTNPLGIYLARFASPEFNQLVQLAELAVRDQALAEVLRKSLVASGHVAEVALRDPDTDEILLDDDFNPIKGPRLINGNAAILSKLLERLLASADKPAAPVNVNVAQNNYAEQQDLVLIDPMEDADD